jgi:glycosidase
MWAYDETFYQIYTLGFCGAPRENDGRTLPRILKVTDWIPHIRKLAGAVYFCPVFSSDSHGYDTRDYRTLDCRLGTNGDFAQVCAALRREGIKVVLDGVFNHVGRGFWAFQDVRARGSASPYRDWFFLDFDRDSAYHDGFGYQDWEGHPELVRLNLESQEVSGHLLDCVDRWIREFDIDGLRLDVAYCLAPDFMRRLRAFCDSQKADFFLVGEVLHGDYNDFMSGDMLHSVTNYQAYKGIWSSLNDMNLFEIAHTLERHFAQMYVGKHPMNFVDNHDVNRIASALKNPAHLRLAYGLMFGMPGIPCVYYGSEWGAPGQMENGRDHALRPFFDRPDPNDLTEYISKLSLIHKQEIALRRGDYQKLFLTNRQFVFQRTWEDQRILVAINADSQPCRISWDIQAGEAARDLISGPSGGSPPGSGSPGGQGQNISGGCTLEPYGIHYWKLVPLIG